MVLTRGGTAGCTCSTTSSSSGPTMPSWVTRNAAAFLVCLLSSAANNIFIVAPGISAQHQHRDGAMGENVLGFAAEQDALEALAAVRGHDDQVALAFLRGCHDRLGDQVGFGDDGLGLDALGLRGLLHGADHRLALVGPLL